MNAAAYCLIEGGARLFLPANLTLIDGTVAAGKHLNNL
jgi:hypothetical protein